MGRGWVLGKKRNGGSGYYGVYRMRGRWRVTTFEGGKNVFWGSYKTNTEAAERYNKIPAVQNGLLPKNEIPSEA